MRQFEYFLFENYDADEESANPYNPRRILGKETDPILSDIIDGTDFNPNNESELIRKLITAGVVRWQGKKLKYDCPVSCVKTPQGFMQRLFPGQLSL